MTQNYSFLPVYDFSHEINAQLVRKILPLMTQHNVPINPLNYAIWYEYAGGNNHNLNSVIDDLLVRKAPLDSDLSFNLYTKYICNASLESYEKTSNQLQHVFSEVSNSIQVTHQKTIEVNHNFNKNKDLLQNLEAQPVLQNILQDIIQETKSLNETSLALQEKLNNAHNEIAQLREELNHVRTLALTDALTGLMNRRAFNQTLEMLIDQSTEDDLFLAMLDIDHFKNVNDTHGHLVGDHIIKYVATIMKKHTDESHYLARFGGEELTIIYSGSTKEKAIAIAENIRNALEKSHLKRKDNKGVLGKITISIGITVLQSNDNLETLIKRADKALYTAKETGRNKVVFTLD